MERTLIFKQPERPSSALNLTTGSDDLGCVHCSRCVGRVSDLGRYTQAANLSRFASEQEFNPTQFRKYCSFCWRTMSPCRPRVSACRVASDRKRRRPANRLPSPKTHPEIMVSPHSPLAFPSPLRPTSWLPRGRRVQNAGLWPVCMSCIEQPYTMPTGGRRRARTVSHAASVQN